MSSQSSFEAVGQRMIFILKTSFQLLNSVNTYFHKALQFLQDGLRNGIVCVPFSRGRGCGYSQEEEKECIYSHVVCFWIACLKDPRMLNSQCV